LDSLSAEATNMKNSLIADLYLKNKGASD